MFRQLSELFGNLFDGGDADERRRNRYGGYRNGPRRWADEDRGDDDFTDEEWRGYGRRRSVRERESAFDLE
jgi:hypothetical protein